MPTSSENSKRCLLGMHEPKRLPYVAPYSHRYPSLHLLVSNASYGNSEPDVTSCKSQKISPISSVLKSTKNHGISSWWIDRKSKQDKVTKKYNSDSEKYNLTESNHKSNHNSSFLTVASDRLSTLWKFQIGYDPSFASSSPHHQHGHFQGLSGSGHYTDTKTKTEWGGTRVWIGDLSICSRMLYHWAIPPLLNFSSAFLSQPNFTCYTQSHTVTITQNRT